MKTKAFWKIYVTLGIAGLTFAGLSLLLKAHGLPGSGLAFGIGFLLVCCSVGMVWVRVIRQLMRK